MHLRRYRKCTIEIACGNMAEQPDIACVVNATNAGLLPTKGVSGALHAGAGPQLAAACRPLAPIAPGQAVITPAFNLPNCWIIHCLGPEFVSDEQAAAVLRDCYTNSLRLCEAQAVESVAFPAISAGGGRFPPGSAADVALDAVFDWLPAALHLQHLRLVLWDKDDLQLYLEALERHWQRRMKRNEEPVPSSDLPDR